MFTAHGRSAAERVWPRTAKVLEERAVRKRFPERYRHIYAPPMVTSNK